jgi:hypothetical protein
MSCRHGWHDCGPWYGPPPDWGWHGPADWYDEADRPVRPRYRRTRRLDRGPASEDLEARLAELRDDISRIESELVARRSTEVEGS